MLQQQAPPDIQWLDPQASPYIGALEDLSDRYALGNVIQTFSAYETWRNNNCDPKWRQNDMLYFGAMPQQVWEGTQIPKPSLAVQITFDQVESALSTIMQALFPGDEWFDVEAEPGADPKEARQIAGVLRYYTDHCKNEYGHTAEVELESALQSTLQYGNGFLHVYWDPVMRRPAVEFVDIRDIYIDPGTPSPNVQEARSVVWRRLMTVDELDAMRDDPRMKIPPRDQLVFMSMNRSFTIGDTTIRMSEAQRRVSYSPGSDDFLPLPSDQYVEVLIYYSKTKIIWVLNRQHTAYNRSNPYGFIPFCSAPCYSVLRRFYAQSVCDVLEGNQLYMQGLLNAHLAELSLAINPPRSKKQGGAFLPSDLAWRPGLLTELADAEDMIVHNPSGITANIDSMLSYIELLSERRTGISSMGQGVPRASNANRTLGGMQMQMSGVGSRLYRIVNHAERYYVVPMLYLMYRLIQYHAMPTDKLPAMMENGEYEEVAASSFNAPVRFKIQAASKMATREKLAQVVPFIAQYIVAGPVLAELMKIGKVFDFQEFSQMIQDAAGTARKYALIRDQNEQEKEAASKPDPKTQAEMQKAQMEQQTRLQMGQMKSQGEMQKAQMENQTKLQISEEGNALEILKMIAEELLSGGDVAREEAKLKIEQALGQQKLQHKEREHQMKLQQQRESTAAQVMTDQVKLAHESRMASGRAQIEGATAVNKLNVDRVLGAEKLRANRESSDEKLRQSRELGDEKIRQSKALRALGTGGGRGKRGGTNKRS